MNGVLLTMPEMQALVAAIFSNWLALMTGILGLAMTAYGIWRRQGPSRRTLLAFGFGLLLSPILAWRDEYRGHLADKAAWDRERAQLKSRIADRVWEIRQAHLRDLRKLLEDDAQNFQATGSSLRTWARVVEPFQRADVAEATVNGLLRSHDILVDDIQNHYPEYAQKRKRLVDGLRKHDAQFNGAHALMMSKIPPETPAKRREEMGRALFLQTCLKIGPGLTFTETTREFEYQGHHDLKPVPDEILTVVKAFRAFQADAIVTARCNALRARAEQLEAAASKLEGEARRLALQTDLAGECQYTRLVK